MTTAGPSGADADVFLKKLGARPDQRLLLVRAPDAFAHRLASGRITIDSADALAPGTRADIVILWLWGDEDLDALFPSAEQAILPEGAVWAVIPRKATPRGKTFPYGFDVVQPAGLRVARLVDNKELSFLPLCCCREYSLTLSHAKYRRNRRAVKSNTGEIF